MKSKISGFAWPRRGRLSTANRPNQSTRVFFLGVQFQHELPQSLAEFDEEPNGVRLGLESNEESSSPGDRTPGLLDMVMVFGRKDDAERRPRNATSVGSPSAVRKRAMLLGSVSRATSFILPLQTGHSRTSIANVPRRSSVQGR
ncbi:hypothetical protein ACMHYB_13525 [Sorangium sp. So ce1128]